MPSPWTRIEVEAAVADYFDMLRAELRGESFNKTAHRRALAQSLSNRSDGSIERKHQNISAALLDLGCPFVDGYKPLSNYQHLVLDVVADRLRSDSETTALINRIVHDDSPPDHRSALPSSLLQLEPPPDPTTPSVSEPRSNWPTRIVENVDYLAIETHNRSLGLAGEELVLEFEARRLHDAGARQLANRIEHVSRTKGDGLGYDIHSFDADGADRLIEVKTTSFNKRTPFFVTPAELRCSKERMDHYHLYRLFAYRKSPGMFAVRGALDDQFRLEASEWRARL